MDISRKRQRVDAIHRKIGALLAALLRRSPVFAASLYEQKVQCGKPSCKCARSDYRHRMWCVSFLEDGKSRTRVVSPPAREGVEKMTRDYRRFRQARRQIKKLCQELVAAIDAVGNARSRGGKKEYDRLAGKARRKSHGSKNRGGAS
jgi:hypothetical protein